MPESPKHACSYPGCRTLVVGARCPLHALAGKPEYSRLYHTARWRRSRLRFLRDHPLCECPECQAGRLRLREATVVDHSVPHRGDETIFWDETRWTALAKACHDRKTGRETSERRREHRAVEG